MKTSLLASLLAVLPLACQQPEPEYGLARIALDAISERLQAADSTSLHPRAEMPVPSSSLQYARERRTPEGTLERLGTERIELDAGRVVLVEEPGTPEERRSVLCDRVAPLLEGEVRNGRDDNGNGLIDEPGLCFVRYGNLVTVYLTAAGETFSTAVTLRYALAISSTEHSPRG